MQISEIMTKDPVCCTDDTRLQEVAKLMLEHDCGAIPVVESKDSKRPIGIISDRDIVCRGIAAGNDVSEMTVRDCMTSPCVTVGVDDDVETAIDAMEGSQIRRIVVVDKDGAICGIVAQADIAKTGEDDMTGELVEVVSRPSQEQPYAQA